MNTNIDGAFYNNLKQYVVELYNNRNILKGLIIRNLTSRYKNSILGFGWHFVMPIMMLIIYYIVFTQIRISSIPDFWLFISTGIFPFNYLLSNLTGGSSSIISNAGLIKKMYFPREMIVLSQVISSFIILIIGYIFVFILMVVSGYDIAISLIFLPLISILMLIFTTGMVLILSAITVYVRDIQYVITSISTVFFFVTPLYFMTDDITGTLSTLIWLNPFTYFVELHHQVMYMTQTPDILLVGITVFITSAVLVVGIIVFVKLKKGFAERL